MKPKRAKTAQKEPRQASAEQPHGCEAIAARRKAGVAAYRKRLAEAIAPVATAILLIVGACVLGCSLAQPIAPNAAASNTATNTANTAQTVDVRAPTIAAPAKVELPPSCRSTTTQPGSGSANQ